MFWLSPDTVPTMGDWFRAGGYRTFFKGKWHASHVALPDPSGEGFLLSIDDEGVRNEENIAAYLEADLLDEFGFSEWVGPEPHGLGKHNTGSVKDVLKQMAGINLNPVNYKGSAPALIAIMSGEVQVFFGGQVAGSNA